MSLITLEEDLLRERLIAMSPQLSQQAEHIASLLRELVSVERQKMGLDQPRGAIWLYPNKDKKLASDPDLIGNGNVAGSFYQAAAWISGKEALKIGLTARKRP